MKHIVSILSLVLVLASASANDKLAQANALYTQSKFEEAIKLYQQVLGQGQESAALYFNLGNAYYRTSQYTRAILQYERALLLDPNNEAIEANLKTAQGYLADKIDAVPEFFLNQWFRAVYSALTPGTWAVLSMVFFAVFILGLSLYFFSVRMELRKSGFALSVLGLLFSVASLFVGNKQYQNVHHHPYGIVLTPSLTVVSAPNDQGSELFVVHEGIKVRINQSLGEWREIRLANGNVGWVKASDLEMI